MGAPRGGGGPTARGAGCAGVNLANKSGMADTADQSVMPSRQTNDSGRSNRAANNDFNTCAMPTAPVELSQRAG